MDKLTSYSQGFKVKYEKFLLGCDSIEEMGLWNKEEYGEMNVYYEGDFTGVIIRLIAADGKITDKEVTYLNDIFGFEYSVEELEDIYNECAEDIKTLFEEGTENGYSRLRAINEKLAEAYKDLMYDICDIIIESDGVISNAEIEAARELKDLK